MSSDDRRTGRVADLRSSLPDGVDVLAGGVAGACAFLVGFVLTALVEWRHLRSPDQPVIEFYYQATDVTLESNVGPSGPLPGLYEFTAWQYHSLHAVSFEFGGAGVWHLTPQPARPLAIVPFLALAGAGALVVSRSDAAHGARRGALVVVGYLPLAAVTAATSTWNPPESVQLVRRGIGGGVSHLSSIGVSTLDAVVFTGLLAPVAFGALGGYLFSCHRTGDWPTATVTRGALAGALAFAAGWVVTYLETAMVPYRVHWLANLYTETDSENSVAVVGEGVSPPAWTGVTWVYHGLHSAAVDVRYLAFATDGVDAFEMAEWKPLAMLVPLLLVAAGAVVVTGIEFERFRDAVFAGAAVALGYFPLAVLTALLAVWTPDSTPRIAVGVAVSDAVTLTGLAAPVFYGGVGGVVAYSISATSDRLTDVFASVRA